MAEITAALVKELRDKTGAGMMDCKKALAENAGDIEAAVDWLRTKGLAAAAKKAGRVAADGLIGVAVSGKVGALAEVNSETDFVARNDRFQDFVRNVADLALANEGDLEAVMASGYPGENRTVAEQVTHLVATIGENMNIRRTAAVGVSQGHVAAYVHNATADGLGKIGVLVALESEAGDAVLEPLGKQLAMHIAAAAPRALTRDGVNADDVQRERDILAEKAKASGKPDNIVEKMVEGGLRKFYQEIVLTEQTFVIDGERKISQVLEDAGKAAGKPVVLAGYLRFALGEGIEKAQSDFAAEVAAVAGV